VIHRGFDLPLSVELYHFDSFLQVLFLSSVNKKSSNYILSYIRLFLSHVLEKEERKDYIKSLRWVTDLSRLNLLT
jgi:hypothetical protein